MDYPSSTRAAAWAIVAAIVGTFIVVLLCTLAYGALGLALLAEVTR